ncbi:MAG: hypothetical protein AAB352_01465 [Patescibacteria group bacterium]
MNATAATMPIKDQRNELIRKKFIHVTGLPVCDHTAGMDEEEPIQALHYQLGSWGYNEGHTVAVLENGEVWIRAGGPDRETLIILHRTCPHGNKATPPMILPCAFYLLGRHTNPFDNFCGIADPTPRPHY